MKTYLFSLTLALSVAFVTGQLTLALPACIFELDDSAVHPQHKALFFRCERWGSDSEGNFFVVSYGDVQVNVIRNQSCLSWCTVDPFVHGSDDTKILIQAVTREGVLIGESGKRRPLEKPLCHVSKDSGRSDLCFECFALFSEGDSYHIYYDGVVIKSISEYSECVPWDPALDMSLARVVIVDSLNNTVADSDEAIVGTLTVLKAIEKVERMKRSAILKALSNGNKFENEEALSGVDALMMCTADGVVNPPRRIIDTFLFFQELDVLEVRLVELYPVVTAFVLVEATRTHTNAPKPLIFAENAERFARFMDKIEYVAVNDLDVEEPVVARDGWNSDWVREGKNREAISRGIAGAASDDIVLLSDTDEIPTRRVAEILKFCEVGLRGDMTFELNSAIFYYNLNWIWHTPISSKGNGEIAMFNYGPKATTVEWIRKNSFTKLRQTHGKKVFKNMALHLSYFGGVEPIRKKILSYAHQELNTAESRTDENIRRAIDNGEALFFNQKSYARHETLRPSGFMWDEKEGLWSSRYTDILHAFKENPEKYKSWAPMTPRLRKRLDNPLWDEKPSCNSLFCAEFSYRHEARRGEKFELSVSGCEHRPSSPREVWRVGVSGPETSLIDLVWDGHRKAHVGMAALHRIGSYNLSLTLVLVRPYDKVERNLLANVTGDFFCGESLPIAPIMVTETAAPDIRQGTWVRRKDGSGSRWEMSNGEAVRWFRDEDVRDRITDAGWNEIQFLGDSRIQSIYEGVANVLQSNGQFTKVGMQKWDSALNSSLLCAPGSKGLFLLGLSIQDIRESEDTLFGRMNEFYSSLMQKCSNFSTVFLLSPAIQDAQMHSMCLDGRPQCAEFVGDKFLFQTSVRVAEANSLILRFARSKSKRVCDLHTPTRARQDATEDGIHYSSEEVVATMIQFLWHSLFVPDSP